MGKLTPSEAVKAICRNCLCVESLIEERLGNCEGTFCTLYPYRFGKRVSVKTFRKYCLQDCMNGYRESVETCQTETCALHPYRFGKNPAYEGHGDASRFRKGVS